MSSLSVAVIDQISAAMSVRTLQHHVIASNIANRDAHGYQRLKVRFDHAMGEATAASVAVDRADAPVSLEQDLLALTSNSAHYEAMARVLGRYFSIISAITSYSRG